MRFGNLMICERHLAAPLVSCQERCALWRHPFHPTSSTLWHRQGRGMPCINCDKLKRRQPCLAALAVDVAVCPNSDCAARRASSSLIWGRRKSAPTAMPRCTPGRSAIRSSHAPTFGNALMSCPNGPASLIQGYSAMSAMEYLSATNSRPCKRRYNTPNRRFTSLL